jgi:hypothetical protein
MADELGNASDDLIGALLGTQQAYVSVLKPVLEAVKQMREVAEVLPASRQSAGFELLQQFGAQVVVKSRDGDLQGIHEACNDFVGRFRRLAGN